ncbi:hypothetical protein BJ742DRAFT_850120 [Cladochytrium replicatum]|nr:hypothetical protein BJ742DRAFT_850120 [Cladochytrium replicatum]
MELCGDLNFIINQFDRFSRFVDTLENSTFLFSPRGNSPTSLLVRSPASCLSFNTFIRAITLSSGKEWPKMDASHLILVIATTCPAIERLEIVRCNELSIAALAALASGCPKLRALSIVGSSSPYGDLRAKPLHINTFPEDETELSMKCSTDASVPEKHRVPFLKNSCTIEDHQLVLRRLTSFRLSLIRWNYLESALQSVGNLQYLDLSRPFDSKDDNDQDSQALRAAIEKSPALRGLWLSTLGPGIMPPKSMNAQTHSLLSPSDLCLATPTRTGFAQVPQILDESISLFDVIRQSCRQLEVLSIRPRRYCGISNGLIRFLSNEVAAANLVKLAIQTDLLGAEGLIQLALHANKLDHLLLDGSWDQIIHTKSSSYGRLRGGMLDSSASRKKPKSDPTVRAAGIPRNYSNRGQSLSQQVALSNMAARMKLIPPSKSAATCSEPTHVNALAAEPSIRKLLPKAQAHHSLSMAPLQRHISPPGSRSTRGKVTKEAAMEPQKKLIDSLERLIEMRGKQLKTLSLYGWAELITETRVQVLAVLLPNLINLDLRSTAAARTVDVRADEAGVRSPKVRAGADDVGVRTRLQLRKQMQGGVSNTGSGRSGQKAESAWDTGEHGGSSSKRGSPLRSVTSAPIPPRVSPAKRSHPENSFWSSLATSCTRLRSVSLYEDATNKVREAKSSESRPDFDGDDFEDRVFKGDWGRLE